MFKFLKFLKKNIFIPEVPEIGTVYMFKPSENPFAKIFFVRVLAVSKGWVKYVPCKDDGTIYCYSLSWSNDIKSFNYCYKKMEVKHED